MNRLRAMGAAAAFATATAFAGTAAAAGIWELAPAHEGGFGEHGLWLGPDSWRHRDSPWLNWEWNDVGLSFESNGDAWITGTMKRLRDDSVWSLEIHLTDFEFTGSTFDGIDDFYDGWADDLLASREDGAGIEWGALQMTVDAPYRTLVPEHWRGLAMPNLGHWNVAELHYDAGVGLNFDAWYQREGRGMWYDVGDTKARVGRGSAPVPEPSAALAFGLGWALLFATRRRERR